MTECVHVWINRFENVVASYQGESDSKSFYADGNVQTCGKCYAMQFIPHNPELQTVPCDISSGMYEARSRK